MCATPNGLAVGTGVAGRAATALKTSRSSSISTELTNPRLLDRVLRRFIGEPSSVSLWTDRHVQSSLLDKNQVLRSDTIQHGVRSCWQANMTAIRNPPVYSAFLARVDVKIMELDGVGGL
jgi:hypothetical protein